MDDEDSENFAEPQANPEDFEGYFSNPNLQNDTELTPVDVVREEKPHYFPNQMLLGHRMKRRIIVSWEKENNRKFSSLKGLMEHVIMHLIIVLICFGIAICFRFMFRTKMFCETKLLLDSGLRLEFCLPK